MFKKLGILWIVLLLLGCSPIQEETVQFNDYYAIKEKLIHQQKFENTTDFSILLIYNQLEKEYRYDIIIDKPQRDMYNIVAMAYSSEKDDEICPTIGIFENEIYHLKKDYISKENGFYKGIQLSGRTVKKGKVHVYISYYTDEKKTNKVEKYIEVNDEIR